MTRKKKEAATPEELKELKKKLKTLDFKFLTVITIHFFKDLAVKRKGSEIMLTTWEVMFYYRLDVKHLETLCKIGVLHCHPIKDNPEAKWYLNELHELFFTYPKLLIGKLPGY
jgi:hypothetical protein